MPESTHRFIDIDEIREGVVVTSQKDLRAILMVSSINFELKSDDEKEAIIFGFQRFLNAVDEYSLQFLIHSRPLELSEYFVFLREQQEKQENELLKVQTTEYVRFVEELLELSNIMAKFFYVVVPYNTVQAEKMGLFKKVLHRKQPNKEEAERVRFSDAKDELLLRVNHVISLLGEMDLRSILLSDQEIVELFYGLYNPGSTLKQTNLELLIATGKEEKHSE